MATYPLDLIITRLQIQRQLRRSQEISVESEYENAADAARKIYRTEGGIAGLYVGLVHDTAKTVADSFLFFLAYNFLRRRRLNDRYGSPLSRRLLPPQDELSIGFVAGATTKLLTTPLATVVTRKQTAAMTARKGKDGEGPPYSRLATSSLSTQEIVRSIYDEKGMAGFWSGYSASLVLTLNPSITFFLFELFKRAISSGASRDAPSPSSTFLIAAISKAIASSITYPFSLAKARAQSRVSDSSSTLSSSTNTRDSMGPTSTAKPTAMGSTIFSTLLSIADSEGGPALYEGLSLEVLKGFFSHGITMLVKQSTHRIIIKIYYLLSSLLALALQRPKVGELMQRVDAQRVEYFDLARERVKDGAVVAGAGLGKVGTVAMDAMGRANETAELVADYVEEEADEWRTLYTRGLWGTDWERGGKN